MEDSTLTCVQANNCLWQRNRHSAFHRKPFSTHIDPQAYFHTLMDDIVPPSPLLVQIIMNQYALKAVHTNIILKHELFPPVLCPCALVSSSLISVSIDQTGQLVS